jgi:hypothetical protein
LCTDESVSIGDFLPARGAYPPFAKSAPLRDYVDRRQTTAMFDKVSQPLQKLFGLTLGWTFFLFSLLAVPLSVVTLMRWFQLAWWAALIAVFAVTLIPYAGRFAYLGLALIGAYYVVEAGFSFSGAAGRFID